MGHSANWKSDRFTGAEVLKAAECALRQMLQEQCRGEDSSRTML
jgi:hypothetical protein